MLLPSFVTLFDDAVADVRDKALAFSGKMKNEYGDKFCAKEFKNVPK